MKNSHATVVAVAYTTNPVNDRYVVEGHSDVAAAVRIAPLIVVAGVEPARRVVVGYTRILVDESGTATYEVTVTAHWHETGSPGSFEPPSTRGDEGMVDKLISEALEDDLVDARNTDSEARASQLAKHRCEQSRQSLVAVREIRYRLEERLAGTSSTASASNEHTTVVSALLQLGIMCGRAADHAREAVREGLWVWLSDREAYHSYRKLQDQTILSGYEAATEHLRPWIRDHDSAVRHCVEMRSQLDGESDSIRSLIASASSISSSKDADAQSRFNVLAAIASLGLGLPALVLALYGADIILPLNTPTKGLAFTPVILALVAALVLAVWQGIRLKRGWVWTFGAVAILLVLVLLLISAGILAPARA